MTSSRSLLLSLFVLYWKIIRIHLCRRSYSCVYFLFALLSSVSMPFAHHSEATGLFLWESITKLGRFVCKIFRWINIHRCTHDPLAVSFFRVLSPSVCISSIAAVLHFFGKRGNPIAYEFQTNTHIVRC